MSAVTVNLQNCLRDVFSCNNDVAASIAKSAHDRQFSVSTVLLKQGDKADLTFLLIAGRAHALTYGVEGKVILLHEFLVGDFFGAVAFSEQSPEEANVVAIEDVRAAVFRALDFLRLIETYSCVGLVVSRALYKQLRATSARMTARTTLSAAGRVYAELLRLARAGDGRTARPAPVHTELATTVNTTRETVSRAINHLIRRGIVRREGNVLVIVAPQRLEELIV